MLYATHNTSIQTHTSPSQNARWICRGCTFSNANDTEMCVMCSSPKMEFYPLCLCKGKLKRFELKMSEFICDCCCQSIEDNICYKCSEDDCLYKRTQRIYYDICAKCLPLLDTTNFNLVDQHDTAIDIEARLSSDDAHIFKRLMISLTIISSVTSDKSLNHHSKYISM